MATVFHKKNVFQVHFFQRYYRQAENVSSKKRQYAPQRRSLGEITVTRIISNIGNNFNNIFDICDNDNKDAIYLLQNFLLQFPLFAAP